MSKTQLLVALLCAASLASEAVAQRGGGGGARRDGWLNRPMPVLQRFAVYFQDVPGPATDGDKVADLATTELVRSAATATQATVLYLYDGALDREVRNDFDRRLFASEDLNLKIKGFHCGRIDVSADPALAARFGDELPLFAVFGPDGKPERPLSMAGYKPDPRALEALLDRNGKSVKPSLAAFCKSYLSLLHDLTEVLNEQTAAKKEQARAGKDKAKVKQLEKELAALAEREQALLKAEQELLEKAKLPARPADAVLLGWPNLGGGGGGGGGGAGRGGGQPPVGGDRP